jgi:hypothetical protein
LACGPREVPHVRGDDQPPAGDLVADELRRDVLALGNADHFGSDDALAGGLILGHGIILGSFQPSATCWLRRQHSINWAEFAFRDAVLLYVLRTNTPLAP